MLDLAEYNANALCDDDLYTVTLDIGGVLRANDVETLSNAILEEGYLGDDTPAQASREARPLHLVCDDCSTGNLDTLEELCTTLGLHFVCRIYSQREEHQLRLVDMAYFNGVRAIVTASNIAANIPALHIATSARDEMHARGRLHHTKASLAPC